ncbi:hypothetical protein [Kitasatospora sp. NPDC094011]|uniref:hypothetical protein n=1 Tax=Kitasatospora sp. NPDC094011 TaxID=3364090 RepID=UPI003816D129
MPRIPEAVAIERMRERGAEPLEPFPGTQKPWRCRCLTCGFESSPRYNDVVNKGTGPCRGGCRSRKISASLALDPGEAAALMRAHGWDPLEDYPGAGTPWKCRCATCDTVSPKKLAHVQNGRGGCRHCLGMAVTDAAARLVMTQANLEPLGEYRGSQEGWLSRCQLCQQLVRPTYSHVKARGHQCRHCRGGKISTALRFGDAEAVAMMLDSDLEPLVSYPGSMKPWASRCLRCGYTVAPSLHNVRAGQGGCTHCAKRGIDLGAPGYLYVVVHDQRLALKVGIANVDERLRQHESQGWRVSARWNVNITQDAREVERETLAWLRYRGIPYAFERGEMKYRGYTETASLKDVPSDELIGFIDRLDCGVLQRVM